MLKMIIKEDEDNLIQLLLNEKKKFKNDGDLLKLQNNYRCPYCQSTMAQHAKHYINLYIEIVRKHIRNIMPVSRKESFTQNLDIVENILCLCHSFYRKIHFSTNEVKENMLKEVIKNTQIGIIFNVNILNLQEIYFN